MIETIIPLIFITGGFWGLINYFLMKPPKKKGHFLGNVFYNKKIKITKQNKFYFDFIEKLPSSNILFVIINIFAILIGLVKLIQIYAK